MKKITVIHGPNLNLLGQRDHAHYGTLTLPEINDHILAYCKNVGIDCTISQFNSESEIINELHQLQDVHGIVINPAAFTHSSVAIRDAIDAISTPVIEVHLSNIHARESFRQTSLTAPVCIGQISGLGWNGYLLALQYFVDH
tara:strand:- start:562 stop:987 length:426 start_codon:yes stop_codon:yes gene_type:complete